MSTVGAIVLAAGDGQRFGAPKALVEVDGSSLLERTVRTARGAGCSPVVVVVGAAAQAAAPLARRAGAEPVENPDWEAGMGSSLRAGFDALSGRCSAAVVLLVDQPDIVPEVLQRLIRRWHDETSAAVVATFAGSQRPPTLLDADVWGELSATVVGDRGAQAWLRANPERVSAVECGDIASPNDIDTPEDLAEKESLWSSSMRSPSPSGSTPPGKS
ncbi:MAG: nucleotidyltransferase family protein [Nitriliruptorales bacterium]|nr:nucleotidyltransferase family protein [Nitriliruptorales bacterium]